MRITVSAGVAWAVLGLGACADGAQQSTADASVLRDADAACDAAGWERASPGAAGLDPLRLADMTEAIRSGEAYPNIHAVLIVRDGRLAYQEYFPGEDERRGAPLGHVAFTPETLHDIRSVSKAIVGALVGIAIDQGLIASADQPLLDFFPEYADLATPAKRRITIRHALTMTSGLGWDESTFPYTDMRNDETGMDRSDDPVRYILSRPVVAEAGSTWNYSGGLTHLLAVVIQRVSGRPLLEYARQVLFDPLCMNEVEWVGRLGDLPSAASGLRLRPQDLAKFGSLYVHGGQWQGRRVVPAAWVSESTTAYAAIEPGLQYGYQQWFIEDVEIGERSVEVLTAWGNGGQMIAAVPDLRMLVTINAGNYNKADLGGVPWRILLEQILPAVVDGWGGGAG
jgi:CubicO group peptidase (beta-lactamase class C family)